MNAPLRVFWTHVVTYFQHEVLYIDDSSANSPQHHSQPPHNPALHTLLVNLLSLPSPTETMKHLMLVLVHFCCSRSHAFSQFHRVSSSRMLLPHRDSTHPLEKPTVASIFALSPLTSSPKSRKLLRVNPLAFLLDTAIAIVAWPLATLLAKIINHHSVRKALGQCIVSGFKDICLDENLDNFLDRALKTVSQDWDRDAREAGQAFPTVVKEFVLGMVGRTYAEEEKDYGEM